MQRRERRTTTTIRIAPSLWRQTQATAHNLDRSASDIIEAALVAYLATMSQEQAS